MSWDLADNIVFEGFDGTSRDGVIGGSKLAFGLKDVFRPSCFLVDDDVCGWPASGNVIAISLIQLQCDQD